MGGEDGGGGGEWDGGLKGEGLGSRGQGDSVSRAPTPRGGEKPWMYIAHTTWTSDGSKKGGGASLSGKSTRFTLKAKKVPRSISFLISIYPSLPCALSPFPRGSQ